jgi:hypothetical protein
VYLSGEKYPTVASAVTLSENVRDKFFGSSTVDCPNITKYTSIQETDTSAMTTANDELHNSGSLRVVENYLDPQLQSHFKDNPLV